MAVNFGFNTDTLFAVHMRYRGVDLNEFAKAHQSTFANITPALRRAANLLLTKIFPGNFQKQWGPSKWKKLSAEGMKWRKRVGRPDWIDRPPMMFSHGIMKAATMGRVKVQYSAEGEQNLDSTTNFVHASYTGPTTIGRVVEKDTDIGGYRVVKGGSTITTNLDIRSKGGKGSLSLTMKGNEKHTTQALIALQEGGRDFWFVTQKEMFGKNSVRNEIKDWYRVNYEYIKNRAAREATKLKK